MTHTTTCTEDKGCIACSGLLLCCCSHIQQLQQVLEAPDACGALQQSKRDLINALQSVFRPGKEKESKRHLSHVRQQTIIKVGHAIYGILLNVSHCKPSKSLRVLAV